MILCNLCNKPVNKNSSEYLVIRIPEELRKKIKDPPLVGIFHKKCYEKAISKLK